MKNELTPKEKSPVQCLIRLITLLRYLTRAYLLLLQLEKHSHLEKAIFYPPTLKKLILLTVVSKTPSGRVHSVDLYYIWILLSIIPA